MKEQDNISEKELREMEISNLLDKEVKEIIRELLTKLGRRMDKLNGNINKEIENI